MEYGNHKKHSAGARNVIRLDLENYFDVFGYCCLNSGCTRNSKFVVVIEFTFLNSLGY